MTTIFGRRELWAIELDPLPGPPEEADPAAAATWCTMRIWAGGRNLSAHSRKDTFTTSEALHWPAAYLARWLMHAWDGFWKRAGWPLPGPLDDPEVACRRLDAQLEALGPDAEDQLIELRDDFVESHSLLSAAGGGIMPHVYLMREGSRVQIVAREPPSVASDIRFLEPLHRVSVDATYFLEVVVGFLDWCRGVAGDAAPCFAQDIERWLGSLDQPESAESVLQGYIRPWGARGAGKALRDLEQMLELPSGWRQAGARFDPSRVPAAVVFRALAPVLDAEDVAKLLAMLRSQPRSAAGGAALDQIRRDLVVPSQELPHQQGYSLAVQVRSYLDEVDGYLDVEQVLRTLGVSLQEADLSDSSVDAATIWDDQRGPVVVINSLGRRNVPWARRMTLAHELCHLLVDREDAAPLMIASTPWAPPEIERRANAFAAELLLPKAGLLRAAGQAVTTRRVDDQTRTSLMEEFQVGETVCQHQLENRLRIYE